MRWVIGLVLACACGGAERKAVMAVEQPQHQPISVEWKVEQGEGNSVNVSLVVDGRSIAIGSLDAATDDEAGTPATCALRAASPRRTEIVCGDANGYVADLVESELIISLVREQRTELKRVQVAGDMLAVKMLSLPFD
jgi:hypothetical protein